MRCSASSSSRLVGPSSPCCTPPCHPALGSHFPVRSGADGPVSTTPHPRAMPLAPPARSGCYATQHGLLDGADGALCDVGVVTCFSMSQKSISSFNSLLNLEPSSEYTLAGTLQGLEHLLHRCWGRAPEPAAASALCCQSRCGDPRRRP